MEHRVPAGVAAVLGALPEQPLCAHLAHVLQVGLGMSGLAEEGGGGGWMVRSSQKWIWVCGGKGEGQWCGPAKGGGGGGLGVQQVHNSIALCAPGVAMDPMWCHCV